MGTCGWVAGVSDVDHLCSDSHYTNIYRWKVRQIIRSRHLFNFCTTFKIRTSYALFLSVKAAAGRTRHPPSTPITISRGSTYHWQLERYILCIASPTPRGRQSSARSTMSSSLLKSFWSRSCRKVVYTCDGQPARSRISMNFKADYNWLCSRALTFQSRRLETGY